MEDHGIGIDPDTEEIDTTGADLTGETVHPSSLGRIDGIDRLSVSGDGAHLDDHPLSAIQGEDVDLAAIDPEIGGDDIEAVIAEEPAGETLPNSPTFGRSFRSTALAVPALRRSRRGR